MGMIQDFFNRFTKRADGPAYSTLTEISPSFTSWGGRVYEQELTRAVVERFASACSKLEPEVVGDEGSAAERMARTSPNPMQTWPAFLKRLAAVYMASPTAFVAPLFAPDLTTVRGLVNVVPQAADVVLWRGEPWINFHLATGEPMALPLSEVCILSRLQVDSDIFGVEDCLKQTMGLIHAQAQAQDNAIRNGAVIRFIGAVEGTMREEDIKKKRARFMADNLSPDVNGSGLLLYDNTFRSITPVEPNSYTMPAEEMQRIENNVFNYFGTNQDVLQNRFDEDGWGAWYEGAVEPFAVALGEGVTRMLYGPTQRARGKRFEFSSNRLAYASNASKRNMVRDMVDRGIISINEAREVLQLPPVDGGDVRVIRGEYVNAAAVSSVLPSGSPPAGAGRAPGNSEDEDSEDGGGDGQHAESDEYGRD